jgi:hypothetical protein
VRSIAVANEIKSAVLHEKFGEHSTLILVDEDYNIHTLTSDDACFHFMLEDVELPNFRHRRCSSSGVYEATRRGYQGYYQAMDGLQLIRDYQERQKAPKKTTPEFPLEVWCDSVYPHIFRDAEGVDHEWPDKDSAWPEVGKIYAARSWQDDPSIEDGCYRIKDENGQERDCPATFFRVLRSERTPQYLY